MSEMLEKGIMECPACGEYSLTPLNRFLSAREGTKERRLPIFSCKAKEKNCGISVAIDSDTGFILPRLGF